MARVYHRGWRRVAFATGIASFTVLFIGFGILWSVKRDLLADADRDLTLLMSLRSSRLLEAFDQVQAEMELWSDTGALKESLALYAAAWQELGPDAGPYLNDLYVGGSPLPEGDRHLLDDAADGSRYSALHAIRQPRVDEFLEIHDYYDVFMVDPAGNVLYSYFKEEDFATNLVNGPWSESGLARAFREASQATDRRYVALVDFDFYGPTDGAPAAFVASPAFDDQDQLLGVLVAQLGIEQVDQVLRFTSGLGQTGETYAVGRDGLMRSNSRFTDESDALVLRVETESVRRALAGETGSIRTRDYHGEEVISAYGLVQAGSVEWAIVAEANVAEILAPSRRLRTTLFVTGALVVLLVGLATAPSRDRPDWLRAPTFADVDPPATS